VDMLVVWRLCQPWNCTVKDDALHADTTVVRAEADVLPIRGNCDGIDAANLC
jgi:hypothetical protein